MKTRKELSGPPIPELKALLSADLVYNQAHLYLQEKHLDSWLVRLDELEEFTKDRVTTIHPGHGKAAGLELIEQTRSYLHDFADAVKSGDAKTAEQRMLGKYPNYHVKQFLTTFSIPAYFPSRLRDVGARNPTAIPVRFGHESLDVGLACLKGKDAESEEAQEHANRSCGAHRK